MTLPAREAAEVRGPQPATPTSARSVAVDTALNLGGLAAPVLAAVVAIPLLNRFLGTDRVGFLTLAWALIGYFSLFDLGIGRALTQLVAQQRERGAREEVPRLVWTALGMMLVLGVAAAVALSASTTWLVGSALRIPAELRDEAAVAVRVLAWTLPLVVTTAGLRGVLEAERRFLVANAIRAPLGVWLVACPLLALPFHTRSLAVVAVLLLAGRAAGWLAYLVACLGAMPSLAREVRVSGRHVGPLLRFGGWMTVSNVVSPAMVYLDRFLVGNRVSLQAVAWYATPFEVVTKMLLFPSALVTVLFPMFSSLCATDPRGAARLHTGAARAVALLMLPLTFTCALFAREGLQLWLGTEFAVHGERVVQYLSIGVFLNGIATIPFALLQGAGRPDWTAKAHLVELPLYAAAVVLLTGWLGITGTAIAWALRMALDLLILSRGVAWLGMSSGRFSGATALLWAGAAVTFASALALDRTVVKAAWWSAAVLAQVVIALLVLRRRREPLAS